MKTPKEILFERNKAIAPSLDNVRRVALKSMEPPDLSAIVRDWLFSMRWHLGGLSAVWLAALLFNLTSTPANVAIMAQGPAPVAKVVLAALAENRRELLELTDALPAVVVPPAAIPPRRSEIRIATEIV